MLGTALKNLVQVLLPQTPIVKTIKQSSGFINLAALKATRVVLRRIKTTFFLWKYSVDENKILMVHPNVFFCAITATLIHLEGNLVVFPRVP